MAGLISRLSEMLSTAPEGTAQPVPSDGIISAPGSYLLDCDRESEGRIIIHIQSGGVNLDLGGHAIRCASSDPATAVTFGIKVDGDRATIRNGSITGCFMGVHAGGVPDVSLERVDFSGNTYIGLCGGSEVRDCIFADIAGYRDEAYAIGINQPFAGCAIENNVFRNLHRQTAAAVDMEGEGVGVLMGVESTGCIIRGNRFVNDRPGASPAIGVWAGDADTMVVDNVFTNFGCGIAASPLGVLEVLENSFLMCEPQATSYAIGAQRGRAAGNVISGYEFPVSGEIPLGSNQVLPGSWLARR